MNPPGLEVGVFSPHTPTLFEAGTHPETERALRDLAPLLAEADAVVVASPHWRARGGFLVQASPRPRCIQDYYGFPPAYYDFRYEPPGDPGLAEAIAAEARADAVEARTTRDWGLDHGHWVPLLFLIPSARVPVVGLSIGTASAEQHLRFGQAVARAAAAAGRRVAVVASGSFSHRLDRVTWGEHRADPDGEAFDRRVIACLTEGRPEDLRNIDRRLWEAAAPEGDLGPLYILLGALGASNGHPRASVVAYERFFTSVSLATLVWPAPGGSPSALPGAAVSPP